MKLNLEFDNFDRTYCIHGVHDEVQCPGFPSVDLNTSQTFMRYNFVVNLF